MNKQDLKDMIVKSIKERNGKADLLRLILGEYEKYEYQGKAATVEQIARKLIVSNNECLAARADQKLEDENVFLKSLLPNYMSVVELKEKLSPLNLEKSGASVGKAISYLKANGLSFLPEDVKKAVQDE